MFYLFKFFSRKKLSLAEEVNRKVMSGYKPSNEALIILFNFWFMQAHKAKLYEAKILVSQETEEISKLLDRINVNDRPAFLNLLPAFEAFTTQNNKNVERAPIK